MKLTINILTILLITLFSFSIASAQTTKYKCMIQMQNYTGKEAYVVVSLIDPQGNYNKTLAVLGPDSEWYNSFPEWDQYRGKKNEKLNAITGASVAGGARSTRIIEIDNDKFDKGYKLRFESSVETQKHYIKDVESPLTTAVMENKAGLKGTGYIRLIRFIKV